MSAIYRYLQSSKMKPFHVSLCIGHSRFIDGQRDGGAVSVGNVNEWSYNSVLAEKIQKELILQGATCGIINYYKGDNYFSAMTYAAKMVKDSASDCALELHFNAASPAANGHEWLYLSSSDQGCLLAGTLDGRFKIDFPNIKPRGLKSLYAKDNGYWFCKLTHCPAVICEPFFGTNENDWNIATLNQAILAKSIADGLIRWNNAK
jgi:N-acetylmuramoyl-L-alanine amidase